MVKTLYDKVLNINLFDSYFERTAGDEKQNIVEILITIHTYLVDTPIYKISKTSRIPHSFASCREHA